MGIYTNDSVLNLRKETPISENSMHKYVQCIAIVLSYTCSKHVTHASNYNILNKIFYSMKTLYD
jgi:hypothetical protein